MRLRIEAANAVIGVEGGVIVPPTGRYDAVLRVPLGTLRPGLINPHDHLHRNHYGRLGHPPYANAYEWGRDIHQRDAGRIAAGQALPRREALLHGAWKNLLAGVTTVVHHDAWEPDFARDFPVRVPSLRTAHSLGFQKDFPEHDGRPLAVHLAEGTDEVSAREVGELARRGLVNPALLAVHACGADASGIASLRAAGAAVVWCPSSNLFLFGRTVAPSLLAPGVDVLLGSDSLLTGAGSLLDELRVARALGVISDDRLESAVGDVAAQRLGLSEPSLKVGAPADLVVLTAPLLEAREHDVAVVMVAGVPRVVDPTLTEMLGAAAEAGSLVAVDGVTRWVSGQGSRGLPVVAREARRVPSLPNTRPILA